MVHKQVQQSQPCIKGSRAGPKNNCLQLTYRKSHTLQKKNITEVTH